MPPKRRHQPYMQESLSSILGPKLLYGRTHNTSSDPVVSDARSAYMRIVDQIDQGASLAAVQRRYFEFVVVHCARAVAIPSPALSSVPYDMVSPEVLEKFWCVEQSLTEVPVPRAFHAYNIMFNHRIAMTPHIEVFKFLHDKAATTTTTTNRTNLAIPRQHILTYALDLCYGKLAQTSLMSYLMSLGYGWHPTNSSRIVKDSFLRHSRTWGLYNLERDHSVGEDTQTFKNVMQRADTVTVFALSQGLQIDFVDCVSTQTLRQEFLIELAIGHGQLPPDNFSVLVCGSSTMFMQQKLHILKACLARGVLKWHPGTLASMHIGLPPFKDDRHHLARLSLYVFVLMQPNFPFDKICTDMIAVKVEDSQSVQRFIHSSQEVAHVLNQNCRLIASLNFDINKCGNLAELLLQSYLAHERLEYENSPDMLRLFGPLISLLKTSDAYKAYIRSTQAILLDSRPELPKDVIDLVLTDYVA